MAPKTKLSKAFIVETAGLLADEIGFAEITLLEVAKRLGVKPPSLYNHIDNIGQLRRALALLGLHDLGRRLEKAAVGKADTEAMRAMLEAYRAFAKDRPGLYAATLRAPHADDEEHHALSEKIVGTVLTVLEPFHFTTDEAMHAVRGFRAVGHGFVSLENAGAFGMPLACDESYRRLVSMFIDGVRALRTDVGRAQP